MAGRAKERGGDGGPLWESLLDPVATARAFGDVQAQALRAAGDLVERLARSVDGPEPHGDPTDDGPDHDPLEDHDDEGAPPPGDGARLLEAWIEMLARVARSFGGEPRDASSGGDRVDLDLATGPSGGALVLAPEADDQPDAAGEVWFHNRSQSVVGPLVVHIGDVVSATGTPLRVGWSFDPTTIDEMPARSSRGVTVSASLHAVPDPGTYRGLLQVGGASNGWLPVEIVVAEPESTT